MWCHTKYKSHKNVLHILLPLSSHFFPFSEASTFCEVHCRRASQELSVSNGTGTNKMEVSQFHYWEDPMRLDELGFDWQIQKSTWQDQNNAAQADSLEIEYLHYHLNVKKCLPCKDIMTASLC